jgi:Flp pilus assembly protein TadG
MSRFKNFIKEHKGSASMELALALPVLVMLAFGGFELTRNIIIHQKIGKTVSTMSDLVARSPSLTAAQVDQMFPAVQYLMEPYYKLTGTRVIVSSVANYGAGPVVTWQRAGGGSRSSVSQVGVVNGAATLPAGFTMATNENTIVAEIFYDYTPVVGAGIVPAQTIYRARYNMPRLGALDVLRP